MRQAVGAGGRLVAQGVVQGEEHGVELGDDGERSGLTVGHGPGREPAEVAPDEALSLVGRGVELPLEHPVDRRAVDLPDARVHRRRYRAVEGHVLQGLY
ncbi:hypothetical protein GCM10010324_61270 [Streptomyces hiroshimensis]|uniref:Uncharacterized protein n=1 Tax=Streptomyces hiroshimensis TaxID=66424 RepID=A0ABQ2ZA84_9ACTN|nr:hypothetical protein GCM10010324_61270 [Streptomyces hiroshimensis]